MKSNKPQKESTLQKQIIDYLSATAGIYKFFFFSIPNEGFMQAAIISGMDKTTVSKMSMHLKKMGMVPGMPDIGIIKYSRLMFLEVKTETGKVSDNQKIIHEVLKKNNCGVFVVRNLEEVEKIVKKYF